MEATIKKGTTSKLIEVKVYDSSSGAGAGLTGLLYNASSLTAYYYRSGAGSSTAITLATMTLGTWVSGGLVLVDDTNMEGVIQIGIPDAALASGTESVKIVIKGATNMVPITIDLQLVAYDPQSATNLGLTNIPSVLSLANINAEVDTALDESISELSVEAPTATPSLRTAMMLLYMALRNKTVTLTSGTNALEIYNTAGTKICKKLLTDDGSDYTEDKMTSGA